MAGHARGVGGWWKLALENLGGPGLGLVVELRGLPASLEVGLATAAFNDGSEPIPSRRTKRPHGLRFSFDDVPLTRPKKRVVFPKKKAATAKGQLQQLVSFEVGRLVRRSTPELTFVFRCVKAPPRKAIPFTVSVWPKEHPDQGFTMTMWFGHDSLWPQFG